MDFAVSDKPLVSVLLPVFNSEKSVAEAVESILNQTYRNFELLLIDDCSTDLSLSIIKSFQDSRIRIYVNETNLKLPATLNKGITLCNGKYIARMDADDLSAPNRFELQVEFLEKNPDHILVGSAYLKIIDGVNCGYRKQISEYGKLKSKLFFGNNICHPSVMINKRMWVENGIEYDPSFVFSQDFDLWTRIIDKFKIHNLREPLLIYRVKKENSSNEKSKIVNRNIQISLTRYIKKMFPNFSDQNTNDLFLLIKNPEIIKKQTALLIYFKTLISSIRINDMDKFDFFLRLTNQLKKNLFYVSK
jgi:glycosyltransferase involved in cell wall biosynthesis